MFVDVRGFTALSEKFQPTTMVARLNRFYKLAAQSVFELDGTLDKMVGDQVMAFFGAPFRPEDHAERAVQAALRIVSGAQFPGEGLEGLPVGGGVATGEVFMGNVGEGEVRDFTVIGTRSIPQPGFRHWRDPESCWLPTILTGKFPADLAHPRNEHWS